LYDRFKGMIMRDNYIDQLIVNDGWSAFEQGRPESDCPYPDDRTAAERWLHGHHKAAEYFYWKTNTYSKWNKPIED